MSRFLGSPPDIEKPEGEYPFWVEQPNTKRKVPVVQAFHITKYLGELWIEFDARGEVIKSVGNPILLNSSIEPGTIYYYYNIFIRIIRTVGCCVDKLE